MDPRIGDACLGRLDLPCTGLGMAGAEADFRLWLPYKAISFEAF